MVAKLKSIHVEPDGELDRLLDAADGGPVVLDRSGKHYRLERIEEPTIVAPASADEVWVGYDPVALRRALTESAGSWADVDTDELIAEIYRSREQGDRFREEL